MLNQWETQTESGEFLGTADTLEDLPDVRRMGATLDAKKVWNRTKGQKGYGKHQSGFSTNAKPINDKTFSSSTDLMALSRYDAQDVGGHQEYVVWKSRPWLLCQKDKSKGSGLTWQGVGRTEKQHMKDKKKERLDSV